MFNHRPLLPLFRIISTRPINYVVEFFLKQAAKRFSHLLPREVIDGIDSLFFRDAIGNIDFDGDGREDSFRLTITNPWFDQRINGIELHIDGRMVPQEKISLRSPAGTIRASQIVALDFPPGDALEIIAEGFPLADGFHLLGMTLNMELTSQIIPIIPLSLKKGKGDFEIVADMLEPQVSLPFEGLKSGLVHFIPHIHYDVEWLRTRDVFEQVGAGNLREALRIMDIDHEMTFVIDQVPQLEPFRTRFPQDFEKIVEHVEAGRIEPVNGMYCEPDTNLISGESLIRQSVAWQRYCLSRFGRISCTGWLIDSFGMSAQLPQIFSLSGVKYFAFSRAKPPEGTPTEFIWEAPDGSSVVAVNMPKMYSVGHPMPTERERALRKLSVRYKYLRDRSTGENVFFPAGVDHGRPQEAYGKMIRAWNDEVSNVRFTFSLPSRFFKSLDRKKLPVLKGEFQRELWGTYSSRIKLKQLNRACEFALLDAGKLSAISSLLGVGEFPNELEALWKALMDNHFHDQICGCCTDPVAEGMEIRFNEVLKGCEEIMRDQAIRIIKSHLKKDCIKTRTGDPFSLCSGYNSAVDSFSGAVRKSMPLLVFNPVSASVSRVIEFDVFFPPGWRSFKVCDGVETIPSQILDSTKYGDGSLKKVRVAIKAEFPPLGYRLLEIVSSNDVPAFSDEVMAADFEIRNSEISVELSEKTGLLESVRLGDGTELNLQDGNRLTLERDFGNLYESRSLGTYFLHPRKISDIRVVERGPLKASIEVRGKVGRSPFIQRISLSAGSPRIDFLTYIYFRDRYSRLRCVFPTGLGKGNLVHEVPYAVITRPRYELPAQNFVDLTCGDIGVTLINFGIPGNKVDEDGRLYLTLLRSTDKIFLWDSGPGGFSLGDNIFRYSLYPHRGDWISAGSIYETYLHNNPPRAFTAPPGASLGSSGIKRSFLESDPSRSIVVGFEKGQIGYFARIWECEGRGGSHRVLTGFDFATAYKTNLLEDKIGEISRNGSEMAFNMRPFEIATVVFE